jgi:hypothetical protein
MSRTRSKLELRHSKGELMSFDTVLTQFATKTQQNESFRKVVRAAASWKWFRISRAIMSGRSAAW